MSRMWTAEQIALLFELYSDSPTDELICVIGKSARSIYLQADNLGLRKSEEYLATHVRVLPTGSGNKTQFKRGQTPWNKGLKGVNGQSNSVFKPGQMPHNHKPVGTTRMTADGWLEVKVAEPRKWKGVHVTVWESVHGPVKRGFAVCFKDGNRLNSAIENLELLSRAELMARNTIHRYPQELKDAIRLVKKLRRRIDEHENNC